MPVDLYANDPSAGAGLGAGFINATVAQINSVLSASAYIVKTTATVLQLTETQHARKLIAIETNSAGAATFTLPKATGGGQRYRLENTIVQTQGSIVITAQTGDVLRGKAKALDTTAAADAMVFKTTAASIKSTWNLTTQGGLGFDIFEAIDYAAGVWLVDLECVASGTLVTPFS